MSQVLSPSSPFKLALVQLGGVGADKSKNLAHTREKIFEAAKNGANVVVLPVSNLREETRVLLLMTCNGIGMFQFTLWNQVFPTIC